MRTDYLFAMSSFWTGAARVLDLSGRFDVYNDSADESLADARAIYSDWRMVGQDLAGAMTVVEREQATPQDTAAPAARRSVPSGRERLLECSRTVRDDEAAESAGAGKRG